MEFWDEFGMKISETAEKTKKATETFAEIAKLKYTVHSLENKVKFHYRQIGKLVYLSYNSGDNTDVAVGDLCRSIDELKEQILTANERISELSGTKLCTVCGAKINCKSNFCNVCGAPQEADATAAALTDTEESDD